MATTSNAVAREGVRSTSARAHAAMLGIQIEMNFRIRPELRKMLRPFEFFFRIMSRRKFKSRVRDESDAVTFGVSQA